MKNKINPKAFLARMERKSKERAAGRRRVVGLLDGSSDFRFFTRSRHRKIDEHNQRHFRRTRGTVLA